MGSMWTDLLRELHDIFGCSGDRYFRRRINYKIFRLIDLSPRSSVILKNPIGQTSFLCITPSYYRNMSTSKDLSETIFQYGWWPRSCMHRSSNGAELRHKNMACSDCINPQFRNVYFSQDFLACDIRRKLRRTRLTKFLFLRQCFVLSSREVMNEAKTLKLTVFGKWLIHQNNDAEIFRNFEWNT